MGETRKSAQPEDACEGERDTLPLVLLTAVVLGAITSMIIAWLRRAPTLPAGQPPYRPAGSREESYVDRAAGLAAVRPEAGRVPVTPMATTPAATTARGPLPPKAAPAQPARPTRWSTPTKYIVGIILFLAVLAILYWSRSVFPTVIFAALLAFIVHPIARFFRRRLKVGQGLAVGLTYLLVVLGLLLIPLVLLPAIIDAVNSFIAVDYRSLLNTALEAIQQASDAVGRLPVLNSIVKPILDSLLQSIQAISSAEAPEPLSYTVTVTEAGGMLAGVVGGLARVLGPLVSAVTSLVFMVLVSVYISLSVDQIREWPGRLIPPGYEPEISDLFSRIGDIWSSFMRGQLLLMVFIGIVVWLGNLLLGNSNALLLGVISGFLELIPSIGPAIALIPGVLMALLFGSSHLAVSHVAFALIVLAFYLLVQVFENQIVVPQILGEAVDLPPLVVIIGVLVGGATVGILGIFLASPVIATGREVFLYLYNRILEPPPGPPEEEKASLFDSIRSWAGKVKLPSRLSLPRLHRGEKRDGSAALPTALARGAGGEPAAQTMVPTGAPVDQAPLPVAVSDP